MMRIVHITPNQTPAWAVVAREDGTPEFRPVVAWACMEQVDAENPQRCVAGIALGTHPEPADFDPLFVGYAYGAEPPAAADWSEACAARVKVVAEKRADEEKRKAGQKIIVPGGEKKIVGPFEGN